MQIVSQVNGNEHSSGGGVDAHVVCGVVQELGSGVALNVVRVIVAPSELNVNPVLLCGGAVHHIPEEEGQRSGLLARGKGSNSHLDGVFSLRPTLSQRAETGGTRSTCKTQTGGCLHRTSSSCRTS